MQENKASIQVLTKVGMTYVSVNLSQWETGPNLIRLSDADQAQNTIAQCVIQVTLQE